MMMSNEESQTMRELSAIETTQVSGGGLSNTQKAVLVWTGPAGFLIYSLARGMFGDDPIHW